MEEVQKGERSTGLWIELAGGVETSSEELNVVWNSAFTAAVIESHVVDAIDVEHA